MTDDAAQDDVGIEGAGTWARVRLAGGPFLAATTQMACRPDRPSRLLSAVPAPEGRSLIARGNGLGGGDAAINDGGAVALTGRLDRMLSFDPASRTLVAEAGVTFGDIVDTFLPAGFVPAVCPGARRATLGGALAADAQGWNHVRAGSVGDHVGWLELVTAHGGWRRVSPQEEPALFSATIGGLGLTGVIVRAALRMTSVPSRTVNVQRRAAASLDMLIDALAAAARAHDYARAWIDTSASGIACGRGIVETADIAADAPAPGRRRWLSAPALHAPRRPKIVARLFDEHRYRRASRAGHLVHHLPLDRYLFSDDVASGHAGAVPFTCAVPTDAPAAGLRRLLDIARRSGGAMRAGLRVLGGDGRGMLSFARPGIALALALQAPPIDPDQMRRLEREVLDRGGRVFLAADSNLTDHGFAAMYPRLADLREILARVDPDMRLQSNLARRVRLRDYVV
jgi:FAD/FMN-containing dehydrogenase